MHRGILNCFLFGAFLASCTGVKPRITAVCEENEVGNNIVKWETTPALEGEVKVFASTDPMNIPEDVPVATVPISNQRLTVVTADPTLRYYYSLVFNGRYRVKVAVRNVIIPGIQNFRDVGGYPVYPLHKRVKWGMLYRSAEINNPGMRAVQELKNIGIKTIVDLRSPEEISGQGDWTRNFRVVHVPISTRSMQQALEDIKGGRIESDTVCRIVERVNRELVRQFPQAYRQVFDVLLDEDNYPVVIQCSSGNGRTGVVTALLLAALGVDSESIFEDYRLSNKYYNIPAALRYAYRLPACSQEAITAILSAREDFLRAAREEIEDSYGEVDAYLRKGVGLNKKEIRQLQKILLVPLE